jgi:glycosyltransferase involved in cell wall biosynthesis
MNPYPSVSVIIPTYNRAYILEKSIDSVMSQTFTDYELIVLDDGSTDSTPQLVQSIRESHKPGVERIRYIRQAQQGKSVALNLAVRIANGEWIAFLDSDDIWSPDKLELQMQALRQFEGCDACFTDAQYTNNPELDITAFRRAGRKHEAEVGVLLNALDFVSTEPHGIHIQTLVMRASRVREVGGFDPHLAVLEDHDFVFRTAFALGRICYVNLPLVEIDRTANRAVGLIELLAKNEIRLEQQEYVYEKWLRISGLDPVVRKKIHGYLRAVYSGWANWHLERRQYYQARHAMAAAAHYEFTATMAIKWALISAAPELTRRYLLRRDLHTADALSS